MPELPVPEEQIRRVHADLIAAVVRACSEPALRAPLQDMLASARERGWQRLAAAVTRILDGERSRALLQGLDAEDAVIVEAILEGLRDPTTLPRAGQAGAPDLAAPALAGVIHAAARGDAQALGALGQMGEQMLRAGDDMARLSGCLRRMVDGERDPDTLARGMGPRGESLVLALLDELARLQSH